MSLNFLKSDFKIHCGKGRVGGINFSSFHGAQEKLQKIFRVNFRFFKMDFADVKVRVGGACFFARLWLVAKQKKRHNAPSKIQQ